MCRVLELAPSGYYAWLQEPVCQRALEDVRFSRLIRTSFTASHGTTERQEYSPTSGRPARLAANTAWCG